MRMLADGRAGRVRAGLLGAARALLALPTEESDRALDLPVPGLRAASPHGRLEVVAPVLMIGGCLLTAPVGGYGAAAPRWR